MESRNTRRSTSTKTPFFTNPSSRRAFISYALDYILLLLLIIIFLLLGRLDPFHQHFSLTDKSLSYPHAYHERVSGGALFVICGLAPALIILLYTFLLDGLFSHSHHYLTLPGGPPPSPLGWSPSSIRARYGRYSLRERLFEAHCGLLGLTLASASAYVITGILKLATGKPRPDFIARCVPPLNATDPAFGLSTVDICTQTNAAILRDGFKSFPSGHSSSSWGGLFFLSLFLAGKLHVWDGRGEVWRLFIAMVPSLAASLVAISRIEDARHHGFDVLFGSALGVVCAIVAYNMYFPSLGEGWRKGKGLLSRAYDGSALGIGLDRIGDRRGSARKSIGVAIGRNSPFPHTAPLPGRQWVEEPEDFQRVDRGHGIAHGTEHGQWHHESDPRDSRPGSDVVRRTEFPGHPMFDGPNMERVQRLRTHSRNDSDLHLAPGEFDHEDASEDERDNHEMHQPRHSDLSEGQHLYEEESYEMHPPRHGLPANMQHPDPSSSSVEVPLALQHGKNLPPEPPKSPQGGPILHNLA